MLITDAVALLNAQLFSPTSFFPFPSRSSYPSCPFSAFTNIAIDTRTLLSGDLFIAIKGENFDGHDFLAQARDHGAVAAIVAQPFPHIALPQLIVRDTVVALGELGAWKRAQFHGTVIAITGSCGKTTTRQLLSHILVRYAPTLASSKSFNNHIGVPLTLWQLDDTQHRYAVLEVGANHCGEIAYLTQLVKPHVAVITNAAPSHLEGFGSMENIARAKGELLQGLQDGGAVVLNADDAFYAYWCELAADLARAKNLNLTLEHGYQVVTYEFMTYGRNDGNERNDGSDDGETNAHRAHITARNIHCSNSENHPEFSLVTPQGAVTIHLPLLGEHNVANALAASAAAQSVGVPLEVIKQGLESSCAVEQRLVVHTGYKGAKIIDDSYNATPAAVIAAINLLERERGRIKILVFADMLELGVASAEWHTRVGEAARRARIDAVYTYGERAKIVAQLFDDETAADNQVNNQVAQVANIEVPRVSSDGDNNPIKAAKIAKVGRAFATQEDLIAALKAAINQDTVVLVKGSHGMKMHVVVTALLG